MMMADEYSTMSEASKSIHTISQQFNKTNQSLGNYGSHITKAEMLVREIARKEYWDNIKLLGSFYVFMASALYMFLKRFYLHEIIRMAVSGQYTVLEWVIAPLIGLLASVLKTDIMNYYDTPVSELVRL